MEDESYAGCPSGIRPSVLPSFPDAQVERLPPLRLPPLDRLQLLVVTAGRTAAAAAASAALRDAASPLDRRCKERGSEREGQHESHLGR